MEDVEMGSHRLMTAIETYVQCEPRYITVCAYVSVSVSDMCQTRCQWQAAISFIRD